MENLTNYEYLIIVNYYDYDISWLKRLHLPYRIYYKNKPEKEPFNAKNKAKSESNILKFCYDFYDNLPKNVIFVHQYEYKWYHEGSLVEILNNPSLSTIFKKSKTPGYFNINSHKMCAITPQIWKFKNSGWWYHTMEPFFGKIENLHNFTEGKGVAAQFIVSSDRIRSLPRYFYSNMYNWIVNNEFGLPGKRNLKTNSREISRVDNHILSSFHLSRYLEFTYELIFSTYKKNENCWTKLSVPNLEKTTLFTINDYQQTKQIEYINLRALYGADNYLVNVTSITTKEFWFCGQLMIHPDIKFNQVYADYLVGIEKKLYLYLKKNNKIYQYQLPENRKNIFILNVSNLK